MNKVTAQTPTAPKRKFDVSMLVTEAVGKLETHKGCSLPEIMKFLSSQHQMDYSPGVKLGIQRALDAGALIKVDGNYKITERKKKRKRRRRSKIHKLRRKYRSMRLRRRRKSNAQRRRKKDSKRRRDKRRRQKSRARARAAALAQAEAEAEAEAQQQ